MTDFDSDETIPVDRQFDSDETIDDSQKTVSTGQREVVPNLQRSVFGGYRLIEELGRGGQGLVYLAEDEKLGRRVALKILLAALSFSDSARARFDREAEVASKLDHPGIARIYELGRVDDVPFIAMEFVQGKTLAECIASSKASSSEATSHSELSIDTIGNITRSSSRSSGESRKHLSATRGPLMTSVLYIEDAARTLHAAHEAGLVHRDIKPGNMMVRPDGSACILDFGLARDEDSADAALTQTGDLMGTPAYMSPEQLNPTAIVTDRRIDIYSLGVSLFECCTLVRPFDAPTRQDLYAAIAREEPRRPRTINRRIPKDLEAIILTAIDKNRDRRYATALDFAEDLRRFSNHEAIKARPAGIFVRSARWVRRNPSLTAVFLTVGLSLAIGMGIVANKNSSLRDRGRQLEQVNHELMTTIENERRARLEADGVASTIETVLASITTFEGTASANVTVRTLLNELSRKLQSDPKIDDIVKGRIHYTLGNTYRGLELSVESEKHWLLALRSYRLSYPEGNVTVARLLHHLADLRTRRNYSGEMSTKTALNYLAEARGIYVRLGGEGSVDAKTADGTAAAIELIGVQGDLAEIPVSFVRLLRSFHPKMSAEEVRDGLSQSLVDVSRLWVSGDRDGASRNLRRWLAPTLKGHPFVVNQAFIAITRVADWAMESGFPHFGLGLLYERMNAAKRLRDESSPFVGQCISDFAFGLERQGQLKEALTWHLKATIWLRRVCKPSSIALLDATDYLARCTARVGQSAESRRIIAERLAITLSEVHADDPIFADGYMIKGEIEEILSGADARIKILDEALTMLRLRKAQQNLALVLAWKSEALAELGRKNEALQALDEATQISAQSPKKRKRLKSALRKAQEAIAERKNG